jgi:integrase
MASIRKRGSRWQARINRKGFPTEVKSFTTLQEAEQWSRALESEMDKGAFISRTSAEKTTFKEVLDLYMREVSPIHRSYETETIKLKAIQRHKIASLSLSNVTPKVIADYRDERLATCKANTVIRDLAALSSIFNHCIKEWGYAISNPVNAIRKPSMPLGRDRILDTKEEQTLLHAMLPVKNRNIYMRHLTIVALETAMRRGELLSLKWGDIDFEKRTVHLSLTKNGTSRKVPLSMRAIIELKTIPRSIDGRVFPIDKSAMEYCFKRACTRGGINGLHFHDLRHTATTRLSQKLPNLIELAAVTGHKNVQMLARYYHPKAEDLAKKLG